MERVKEYMDIKRIKSMTKHKKNILIKKVTALLVCICVVLCWFNTGLYAKAASYNGSSIISNNIHDHDYSEYSAVSNSYLIPASDGSFTRVENFGDVILIEKYNSSFSVLWQATVPFELLIFGGFYAGEDNYYFVFGQPNYSKSEGVEQIRVVKYTKDWQRSTAYSVYGQNIIYPFYGCNTDFAEIGNNIYVRCGHLTYPDSSGLYYQGTMTFVVAEESNYIRDIQTDIEGMTKGSVENAGATFIDASYGALTAVDHSRTGSYGLVGMKYAYHSGLDAFQSTCKTVTALGEYGAIGNAIPSLSVGGYETSSQYHLVAVSTTPMDGTSPNYNVAVVAIPRTDFSNTSLKVSYLTGFAQGDTMTCTTPYIVKVNDTKFCVLWEQRDGYSDTEKVYYVFVNASGERLTDTKSIDGCLSDCQPVLSGTRIVWYTTNGANTKIYTVSTNVNTSVTSGRSTSTVYNTASAVYNGVDLSTVFDFSYYCNKYPDIRVIYGNNPKGALEHFVLYGMASGRQASDNFNVYAYKANYADLRNAYGNDLRQYYLHFVYYGNAEGRNARNYN